LVRISSEQQVVTLRRDLLPISQSGRFWLAALVGAVGGLIFLSILPTGAFSTFAHYVLRLPAPGAGIALLVGPLAVVCLLVAWRVARSGGGALVGALAFSLTCTVAMAFVGGRGGGNGMIGSPLFVLALGTSGAVAEIVLFLTRALRALWWRFVLAAAGANVALLIFYWTVIFPRTVGWIPWRAGPVLLAVSLGAGALAGLASWALTSQPPDTEGPDARG